ncbi:MAG: NAD(P)/FAD-dependent oxidoreductase [Lentisphaerae bacterium]|nr:NAD(P)/FAD-dependent oxidoreductase [Lentisphaerota bacterium]
MRIVIVGGGPAALESAIAARKNNSDAEIVICSAENSLPYRRPALSGLLASGKRIDPKTFYIKPEAFFAEQRITLRTGCRIAAIREHLLVTVSGEEIAFDKLILACGGEAVRPPVCGGERAYTLRTLADMETLVARLDAGVKSAVIIGGGVLGLEIAESLISRQIPTTVIEAAPQLFPRKLAASDAAELQTRLNKIADLTILCGEKVTSIAAEAVITESGKELPAEVVIFATGSSPDLTLAKSAGIVCGRGVIVNEFMESSVPDIYAAGDTAEFNGRCFNLYMDAVACGKVAGSNAAGNKVAFTASFSPVRFFALGEKLVMP